MNAQSYRTGNAQENRRHSYGKRWNGPETGRHTGKRYGSRTTRPAYEQYREKYNPYKDFLISEIRKWNGARYEDEYLSGCSEEELKQIYYGTCWEGRLKDLFVVEMNRQKMMKRGR